MAAARELAALKRLEQRIQPRLRRMLQRVANIEKAISAEIVHEVEEKINREGFPERIMLGRFKAQSEHGPGSRKWRPLTPKYKAWRIRQGYGAGPILTRTGVLRAAAIESVRDSFSMNKPMKWDVGNVNVDYAEPVNNIRDFTSPPNDAEMKPIMRRARQIVKSILRRLQKV